MLYEFTELHLEKGEFDNLIFMNAPPTWKSKPEEHKFLLTICRLTLKEVVEKVIEESSYKGEDPTSIFKGINVVAEGENRPWFERHANISLSFDKSQMDKLWIRNLSSYSNDKSKGERQDCRSRNGSFYIKDGNHRALVYAIFCNSKDQRQWNWTENRSH